MHCMRMTMAALGLSLCLLGQALAATPSGKQGEEPPMIFGQWRFGLTRGEALHLPGAKEGTGDFAGHVLLPETTWAGLPWNVSLEFQKAKGGKAGSPQMVETDAGLVRVCLLEAYSRERKEAVDAALNSEGYELLAMQGAGQELDFIVILKAFGSEELQKRIASLYQTDGLNSLSFGWFDTRTISREMKIMARNLPELLQIVRADTREAEVTLLGEDGRASHILVIFSLPVLETQVYGLAKGRARATGGEKPQQDAAPPVQPGGNNANN